MKNIVPGLLVLLFSIPAFAQQGLPLNFPKEPLSAGITLRKVKVGRTYDTVVRIFDASCNVSVWGAMWVFPTDRVGDPIVNIAMTASGTIPGSYPFELRFDRNSKVVDDAGFETRVAQKVDVDQREFIPYALSSPDEIQIYVAFRPVGKVEDCVGRYAVDYEPKAN